MFKTITGLGVLLAALFVSACTIAPPFTKSALLEQGAPKNATAVIGLTHATLGEDSQKNDLFWENTEAVLEDVPNQAGYLGHGVRLKLFGGEAWTMTAWEDEKSLNDFIHSETHRKAMRNGYQALADARFARVTVNRSEVPLSWEKAEEILAKQGHGLKYGPKAKKGE